MKRSTVILSILFVVSLPILLLKITETKTKPEIGTLVIEKNNQHLKSLNLASYTIDEEKSSITFETISGETGYWSGNDWHVEEK